MREIVLETWGDFACFSPPIAKVERYSYPFPTPSAARGLLSSIYNKPDEFYWQVNRIEVLRPIQRISFKRNELKCKTGLAPVDTDDVRTQRQTCALKDVRYRIHASIIKRPTYNGTLTELYKQATRRIRGGKCFVQPCLGLREFVCYFEMYDPEVHLDKPIPDTIDAGLMVYDVFDLHDYSITKKEQAKISLFHARMVNGVIDIPPYDSEEVLKC